MVTARCSTVESGCTVFNGAVIRLTVSVGMAVAPVGALVTYEQLRHAAAAALNDAKANGRNRCVLRVLPGTPYTTATAAAPLFGVAEGGGR